MIRRTLIAALWFLVAFAVRADDTLQNYDVELLIFRLVKPAVTAENWALEQTQDHAASNGAGDGEDTPITAAPPAPTTDAPTTPESTLTPLPTAQFKLNSIEEAMRKGKTYLPIAHFGWTQPGFPLNNAPKLSLQSVLPGFLPDDIVLSGQASLAKSRYLHLLLDLTYQAPDGQKYVLREQRRMRSTEKHYFDHPYFAVIALITPRDK